MNALLLTVLVVAAAPGAKVAKKKKVARPPPAAAAPAPAPADAAPIEAAPQPRVQPRVEQPSGPDPATGAVAEVLASLDALYEALEYEEVSKRAERVLAREDLTIDQRLEAYRLQGSAKAIVEDPVDAEKPFRLLLRARPQYDLPANTPPKILGIFRKVQSEERALATQLEAVQRGQVVSGIRLIGDPPREAKGGLPVKFSFRVKDPLGAVEVVRVPYRRAGQKVYSALALDRSEEGDWKGFIPGDFTADRTGFALEYFVETRDEKGPLLTLGSDEAPRVIQVAPGQVPTRRFRPVPVGVFVASTVVTGLAAAAVGAFTGLFWTTQRQYTDLATGRLGATVEGRELTALQSRGSTYALATNVSMITAGVLAVITLLLWPFTSFE